MSKIKKIKWLMFILSHDGVPPKTLTEDMDAVELYCTLVLLARVYVYVTHKTIPLDLHISIESVKYKYATSKRGVERKRLKYLRDVYNTFMFKWEQNISVCDIY